MSASIAIPFDPETDPDRPHLGEPLEPDVINGRRTIGKVGWASKAALLSHCFGGGPMPEFVDPVLGHGLGRDHASRPDVLWIVWPALSGVPCEPDQLRIEIRRLVREHDIALHINGGFLDSLSHGDLLLMLGDMREAAGLSDPEDCE